VAAVTTLRNEASAIPISDVLAGFALGVRLDDVPDEVIERAKLHMLDAIGIALASSTEEFAHRMWAELPVCRRRRLRGDRLSRAASDARRVVANGAWCTASTSTTTHSEGYPYFPRAPLPAALARRKAWGRVGREALIAYLVCEGRQAASAIAALGGFHVKRLHPDGDVAALGGAWRGPVWGSHRRQLADAQGLVSQNGKGGSLIS